MSNLEPKPIQELNSEVINQIAAGEVVERPAHLVKELVENSLDAGATDIVVKVSEGGRDVFISDNGCGIFAKDLRKALDRHATSKIQDSQDLWNLLSFGFRGEALASISSVSDLTLSSKPQVEKTGSRITSFFGKKGEVDSVGHGQGTSVHVKSLFENIPARLKFLKTAAAESGAIRQVVRALALSRPDVGFQYFIEGKLDLHLPPGQEVIARAESILGVSPLYFGAAEREGVRAEAYFAPPHVTAKTAKNIWIFAQGRWIQDRSLQAAVMDSFRTLLMHGEYPYAVVFVNAPLDQVDVNIHPTKSQVKFQNPSLAFRAVAGALRESLERAPWIPKVGKESGLGALSKSASEPASASSSMPIESQSLEFSSPEMARTQYATKSFQGSIGAFHSGAEKYEAPRIRIEDLVRSAEGRTDFESSRDLKKSGSLSAEPGVLAQDLDTIGYWGALQYLGQANLTYLICQNKNGLVLVDQHAAHERVLFEKIMKVWKEGGVQVQDFLFPLSIDLEPEKKEAILPLISDFERLGVLIEEMGPETIGVRGAPLWIKEASLPKVIDQVATEVVQNGGSFQFETYVADLAATMACHSAVRAGQALSPQESQALLAQMDEFPLSCFCPHGRPVSVDYTFSKLEKDFGRTVS